MSQPGQVSEEGKPVFLFRSSVGYMTTVGPQSLCKMRFSFAFFFFFLMVNTCIQAGEGRQRSGSLPHSFNAVGPAPGADPLGAP